MTGNVRIADPGRETIDFLTGQLVSTMTQAGTRKMVRPVDWRVAIRMAISDAYYAGARAESEAREEGGKKG